MRGTRTWMLAAAVAAVIGCSSKSGPSDGGNGGGGGPVGTVKVGNIFFESGHNGTRPAQDTVAIGQAVTWTWTGTGATSHSVRSDGSPRLHQRQRDDGERDDL